MSNNLSTGEYTSHAILEAAYSLFLEQGYHATFMRQIARKAGVSLSGIYNHFNCKERIFDRGLFEKHPSCRDLLIPITTCAIYHRR